MDVATLQAGRWVENQLAERDRDRRPRHTLEELLGEGGDEGRDSVPEVGDAWALGR